VSKLVFRTVLVCAAIAPLLAGCFAASPQVSYYSLYAPAQKPATVAVSASPLALSIGPVTVPDILKQAQIATGGADGRFRLAEYHRWSGELDRDFARALAEQVAGNLGTEQVAIFPWNQNLGSQWRVFIDVLSMGGDLGTAATLSVRWALLAPEGEKPLVVRRSELQETPAENGYAAWVAAQQRNITSLGEEIAAAVKDAATP